jgi:hypothetical protein
MRTLKILTVLVVLAAAGGVSARAEVAAALDGSGAYACMAYNFAMVEGRLQVWTPGTPDASRVPLNVTGDALGDLAPTVAESPIDGRWPIAVWPRMNGSNYDLAYAVWSGSGWTPARFVATDNTWNDLEPRLVINSLGEAFMVWWGEQKGLGTVYFSMYTMGRWTTPVTISRSRVDSRRPNLALRGDSLIRVSIQTPTGVDYHDVSISRSDTITDDLDPKFQIDIVTGN